jgi:hypothetical protein
VLLTAVTLPTICHYTQRGWHTSKKVCMYVCLCRYLVTVTFLIRKYSVECMIYVTIITKLNHNMSFQCHVHSFCTECRVETQTCVGDIACPCVLCFPISLLSLSLEIAQRTPIKSDIGDYTECYKGQQFSFVSVQGQGFFTLRPSAT